MKGHYIVLVCTFAVLLATWGCGSGDSGGAGAGPPSLEVGASCASDRDCAQRCLNNDDHFPGGMCTLSCRDDRDCPFGTACIKDDGGICAVTCAVYADCDSFGRGYACDDRDRKGAGGQALVCRRP